MPPPCKQASHRSPSQSAPGRPPASWPCAGTRLETQSPTQRTTFAAGLAHHMLSEQLQTPGPLAPAASRDATAGSCFRTPESRASPELLKQMTQRTQPTVPIGSHQRDQEPGGAKEPFPFFFLTGACALQHTLCRFSGAGKDALKLFVDCLCERRDLHADWRQRGRPRRLDRTQWAGGNVNSTRCLMGLLGARDL